LLMAVDACKRKKMDDGHSLGGIITVITVFAVAAVVAIHALEFRDPPIQVASSVQWMENGEMVIICESPKGCLVSNMNSQADCRTQIGPDTCVAMAYKQQIAFQVCYSAVYQSSTDGLMVMANDTNLEGTVSVVSQVLKMGSTHAMPRLVGNGAVLMTYKQTITKTIATPNETTRHEWFPTNLSPSVISPERHACINHTWFSKGDPNIFYSRLIYQPFFNMERVTQKYLYSDLFANIGGSTGLVMSVMKVVLAALFFLAAQKQNPQRQSRVSIQLENPTPQITTGLVSK